MAGTRSGRSLWCGNLDQSQPNAERDEQQRGRTLSVYRDIRDRSADDQDLFGQLTALNALTP